MGRGVSAGGGQSSLGYLFGGGEVKNSSPAAQSEVKHSTSQPTTKPASVSPPVDANKQAPAGIQSTNANYHVRADGQNCGNFLTERPSTKVHAAPGGGSSLGYLFSDGPDGK